MKISFSRAREKNLSHFSSRISRDRDSRQCLTRQVLAAERNPQELSEDDVVFWSYVKPDQRPATVAGAAQDNYSDEESEDNDSGEEGDIDEDMMDID